MSDDIATIPTDSDGRPIGNCPHDGRTPDKDNPVGYTIKMRKPNGKIITIKSQ